MKGAYTNCSIEQLLHERILILDSATGYNDSAAEAGETRFSRRAVQGLEEGSQGARRSAEHHPAGNH